MSYTEEDLDIAVKGIFKRFDADRNGVLDREEITTMMTASYERLGRSKPTYAEITNLFNLYDKNKD